MGGRFELSRFEPRIKALIEQLTEKRLPEEDFPILQDDDDLGSGGDPPPHGLRLVGAMGSAPPGAPAMPATDDWSFMGVAPPAAESASEVSQRIVVFVLGGITLSELRAASEVAQCLPRGTEVLLGGTTVLTPRRLIRVLAPHRPSRTSGAGNLQEDGPDLT